MMPQKSGYEVCTRIRERADWQHIKVIMLSAKGRDAEVNKGLAMGADLYVTKPFSTRDSIGKINALLREALKTALGDCCTAARAECARVRLRVRCAAAILRAEVDRSAIRIPT